MQAGATIRRDLTSLHAFMDAGGFARITRLLQWAALTFGAPSSNDSAGAGNAGGANAGGGDAGSGREHGNADADGAAVSEEVADAVAAAVANGAAAGHRRAGSAGSARSIANERPSHSAPPLTSGRPPLPPLSPCSLAPNSPAPPRRATSAASARQLPSPMAAGSASPGSPLAHPLPGALQRLDSTRVLLGNICSPTLYVCSIHACVFLVQHWIYGRGDNQDNATTSCLACRTHHTVWLEAALVCNFPLRVEDHDVPPQQPVAELFRVRAHSFKKGV